MKCSALYWVIFRAGPDCYRDDLLAQNQNTGNKNAFLINRKAI